MLATSEPAKIAGFAPDEFLAVQLVYVCIAISDAQAVPWSLDSFEILVV